MCRLRNTGRFVSASMCFNASLALCAGNPLDIGGFPAPRASDAELRCFIPCQLRCAFEQTVEWSVKLDTQTRSKI